MRWPAIGRGDPASVTLAFRKTVEAPDPILRPAREAPDAEEQIVGVSGARSYSSDRLLKEDKPPGG